jgi:hypothetical protein
LVLTSSSSSERVRACPPGASADGWPRLRQSRPPGRGDGRNGGRALGQLDQLLGLEHEVVGGQVADGLDPERLAKGLAAPLAKPAQGLDRRVGQLVDVAVLVSTVDVLPCLGSSHGWIASLVIRMVRRRAGIGAGRRDG